LNADSDTLIKILIENQEGGLNSENLLMHWTERIISEVPIECIAIDKKYTIEYVFEIEGMSSLKYSFGFMNRMYLEEDLSEAYKSSVDYIIENEQTIALIVCDSLLIGVEEPHHESNSGFLGVISGLDSDSLTREKYDLITKMVSLYSCRFCKTSEPFDLINQLRSIYGLETFDKNYWESFDNEKPSWIETPDWVLKDTTANN